MLWQICLVLLAVYALISYWRNREFNKFQKLFVNKMKRVPILEHAINFTGDSENRMSALKNIGKEAIYNNDGITCAWLFYKFIIIIGDAVSAETVMKTCLEKDDLMDMPRALIGDGSIFAPVHIWRPRRKLLAPTFGQKTLNSFVKIFTKQAAILTDKIQDSLGNGNISVFEEVTKYSMDSICETALGIEIKSQMVPNHPIPESFYKFCDLCSKRVVQPWLHFDRIYKWHPDYNIFYSTVKVMKQFVTQIIKSKRAKVEQKTNLLDEDQDLLKPKSFLEILIESGVGEREITELELQEEALVMLLAGTDTSSVAMSFTSLMLAKHQDIQEKVYQEIKQVLGNSGRAIEETDLPKLKYLEVVVKETLRLYPPVPVTVRTVRKNVTLPSGVTLPIGSCVLLHIWAIHRNPKYWGPDATKFRPERFFEPLKHPFAFVPFSGGPRNCLGYQYAMMSIKTVMSHLVRRFRILPAKGANGESVTFPDDGELPVKFEIMMKHVGNFELHLELRDN